jgi:hypothetical protein
MSNTNPQCGQFSMTARLPEESLLAPCFTWAVDASRACSISELTMCDDHICARDARMDGDAIQFTLRGTGNGEQV